jgi:hypothetical protein
MSYVQVPPAQAGGNVRIFEIVDAVARAAIDSAGNNIMSWKGDAEPVVSVIPAGVTVMWNNTEYTGTLQTTDESVQPKSRYLVYRGQDSHGDNMYQEYVVIRNPLDNEDTWWEPLGFQSVNLQDLGQLAFEDAVILEKGNGVDVLGKDTQFSASAPNVSVTPSEKGLKANLRTNVAVGVDNDDAQNPGTVSVVKGYNSPKIQKRLTDVGLTKKHLKTAEVYGVNGNEQESASKISSAPSGKLEKTQVPNVTGVGTLPNLEFGYDQNNKMLIIGWSQGALPSLGTPIDVATGGVSNNGTGAEVSQKIVYTSVDVPKRIAAQRVATGALDDNDSYGAQVGTDVSKTADDTVAALGTPDTDTVLKKVKVTQQPVVEIQDKNKDSGDVNVVSGIQSATASAPTITAGNNDTPKVPAYGALNVYAGDLTDMDDEAY